MSAPMPITLGLISDTHMPLRYPALPASIFELLAGVDLILHAGDVGELWVLDELSQIAPVIAVHGNDETRAATHALPYLQTVVLGGHRVVLTHSHYPDRAEEMANRVDDDLRPKLSRLADMAKAHGANIFVFGHWHIPMALDYEDVLIINPGALAGGSFMTKQTLQSVARLTLNPGQKPEVTHYNLLTGETFLPTVDIRGGFKGNTAGLYAFIVDEVLQSQFRWLEQNIFPLAPEMLFEEIYLPRAQSCWAEERDIITIGEIMMAIQNHPALNGQILSHLRENPAFAPYLGR